VSYEDPASLRAKARFVRDRGLAGMMYWEHSEDNGTLLQALYDELRR
jgi:chitinase